MTIHRTLFNPGILSEDLGIFKKMSSHQRTLVVSKRQRLITVTF